MKAALATFSQQSTAHGFNPVKRLQSMMQFKMLRFSSAPRWGKFRGSLGLFLLFLFACTNPSYTPPENALDAGRQFADAVYKGNFKRAADLIVPDEQNKNLLFQKLEEPYHQRTSADRNGLSQASLQILEVNNQPKDSVTLIRILNAYTNQPATLKVIKINDGWRVDLKHSFLIEFATAIVII